MLITIKEVVGLWNVKRVRPPALNAGLWTLVNVRQAIASHWPLRKVVPDLLKRSSTLHDNTTLQWSRDCNLSSKQLFVWWSLFSTCVFPGVYRWCLNWCQKLYSYNRKHEDYTREKNLLSPETKSNMAYQKTTGTDIWRPNSHFNVISTTPYDVVVVDCH